MDNKTAGSQRNKKDALQTLSKDKGSMMASLPANTKVLLGVGDYGIDPTGELLYFSLKCSDSQNVSLAGSHRELADLIYHLQIIATKASALRDTTVRERTKTREERNCALLQSGSLYSDKSGWFATLEGYTGNGKRITLRIEFDLLEQIHDALPGLVAQMREIREPNYSKH